jgi:hypothetical protein
MDPRRRSGFVTVLKCRRTYSNAGPVRWGMTDEVSKSWLLPEFPTTLAHNFAQSITRPVPFPGQMYRYWYNPEKRRNAYSEARVAVTRNLSPQVDAATSERRPCKETIGAYLLWFRSRE